MLRFFLMWGIGSLLSTHAAHAIDLNWSGQFRSEINSIFNYSLDSSNVTTDLTRYSAGGYYIPGGGQTNSNFQNLFLRLRPSIVVNDNIYVKSDWWVGHSIYGLFGSAVPYATDLRGFNSTYSRGAQITAQRVWAEFLSDFGTVQVGRAPLHWGLGIMWNRGDSLWDKYSSTGDMVRLNAKFGSFSFMPAIVRYSMGNSIGGACLNTASGTPCVGSEGSGGAADYSIALMYENPDEDMELGVNFVRRIIEAAQDPTYGYRGLTGVNTSSLYNTWDIYGKRRWGQFTIGAEIPLSSGTIGGVPYSAFGIAGEGAWKPSDSLQISLKAGLAPGQGGSTGATPSSLTPFYFHPTYKLGLIMFNYQLRNFSGPSSENNPTSPQNIASPYDNPITNALYASLGGTYKIGKWDIRSTWVFATAQSVASSSNAYFFNHWSKTFHAFTAGAETQSAFMGWEMDYGVTFHWDESFVFSFDFGVFFPGAFYRFSNATSTVNGTQPMVAGLVRAGVSF